MATDNTATSTEIVTGINSGDRNFETLLIQKYGKTLLYILERRTHDKDLAQDICQETFRILIEKFRVGTIDEPERLAGYIQQTAINLLIAERRKTQRRKTDIDSEALDAVSDRRATPHDEIALMRLRKAVREAILALHNERDKEILYRYYIEEQDKEQVCGAMTLDFRHFDKVISRARSRLKAVLEANNDDVIQEELT
ncbi:MAG: sigma-70 family RNA polymerase sigma factor [Pseudomonadales bacterium]|nr:sigma-70 family RNA polymerase sigma factor [Pseudomonadales bacterium]